MPLLDIEITRENNKQVTLVYSKSTFSDIFTNFESFMQDIYKRGLTETFIHRSFRLYSNNENFYGENETLKSILKHNSYHHNFVNHSGMGVLL